MPTRAGNETNKEAGDMTKLEEVARAVATCNIELGEDGYIAVARAAIEALMEPTDTMLMAAAATSDDFDYLRVAWQAMLKEAMKERTDQTTLDRV